jgi:hypothetical protein
MTTEEMEIVAFLKQYPDTFFTRKEISRKAKRKSEYEENPHWAAAPLASLVMQKAVEQNESGHYKLVEER